MAQLDNAQLADLQAALPDAFDGAELTRLVKVALGEDLASIAGGGPLADVVFNLIRWAERRQRLGDLLAGAHAQRPGNSVFAALVDTLGGAAPAAAPPAAPAGAQRAPGGLNIGKIEAGNVGESQFIDQRHGTFNFGDQTKIDTGGGTYVGGSVNTGGGPFIGRDNIVHGDFVLGDKAGATADDLAAALAPVVAAIRQNAAATVQTAALQEVEALQQELAKGKDADDTRVARILDGIANLVPGAVAAVVGAFGAPLLAGVAGPVTQFVLDQLKRRGLPA